MQEAFGVFSKFVTNCLKQRYYILDTHVKSTIDILNGLFSELHERNVNTFKSLDAERLPRSRVLLKAEEQLVKDVKEKIANEKSSLSPDEEEIATQ